MGNVNPDDEEERIVYTDRGITQRELFAAVAMHALITHYGNNGPEKAAVYATEFADGLIAQLSKSDTQQGE